MGMICLNVSQICDGFTTCADKLDEDPARCHLKNGKFLMGLLINGVLHPTPQICHFARFSVTVKRNITFYAWV